ncbi:unnamed protein product [Acanthosepion pharaonis]|uniref:Uncharacterized protein n=1 Tax=Acanthosepion pharaonis TaxID=158019 RepID=A0A812BPL3_ACAPH|nr:unnamed protein product [Sepia pharaonis]
MMGLVPPLKIAYHPCLPPSKSLTLSRLQHFILSEYLPILSFFLSFFLNISLLFFCLNISPSFLSFFLSFLISPSLPFISPSLFSFFLNISLPFFSSFFLNISSFLLSEYLLSFFLISPPFLLSMNISPSKNISSKSEYSPRQNISLPFFCLNISPWESFLSFFFFLISSLLSFCLNISPIFFSFLNISLPFFLSEYLPHSFFSFSFFLS